MAVIVRVASTDRVVIRTARLRGDRWENGDLLASEARPCASLACTDYLPVAIGWSGARYLAVWAVTNGPGRTGELHASTLDGFASRVAYLADPTGAAGDLGWNGTAFLLAYRAGGASFVARLSGSGSVLEAPARITATQAGSAPDIAVLQAGKAVVVYNRMLGNAPRVLAREITVSVPRQRSVRRR